MVGTSNQGGVAETKIKRFGLAIAEIDEDAKRILLRFDGEVDRQEREKYFILALAGMEELLASGFIVSCETEHTLLKG